MSEMALTAGLFGENASGPDELKILAIAYNKDYDADISDLPSLKDGVNMQNVLQYLQRGRKSIDNERVASWGIVPAGNNFRLSGEWIRRVLKVDHQNYSRLFFKGGWVDEQIREIEDAVGRLSAEVLVQGYRESALDCRTKQSSGLAFDTGHDIMRVALEGRMTKSDFFTSRGTGSGGGGRGGAAGGGGGYGGRGGGYGGRGGAAGGGGGYGGRGGAAGGGGGYGGGHAGPATHAEFASTSGLMDPSGKAEMEALKLVHKDGELTGLSSGLPITAIMAQYNSGLMTRRELRDEGLEPTGTNNFQFTRAYVLHLNQGVTPRNTDADSYPNLFMKGGWVRTRLQEINKECVTAKVRSLLEKAAEHRSARSLQYVGKNGSDAARAKADRSHLVMIESLKGGSRSNILNNVDNGGLVPVPEYQSTSGEDGGEHVVSRRQQRAIERSIQEKEAYQKAMDEKAAAESAIAESREMDKVSGLVWGQGKGENVGGVWGSFDAQAVEHQAVAQPVEKKKAEVLRVWGAVSGGGGASGGSACGNRRLQRQLMNSEKLQNAEGSQTCKNSKKSKGPKQAGKGCGMKEEDLSAGMDLREDVAVSSPFVPARRASGGDNGHGREIVESAGAATHSPRAHVHRPRRPLHWLYDDNDVSGGMVYNMGPVPAHNPPIPALPWLRDGVSGDMMYSMPPAAYSMPSVPYGGMPQYGGGMPYGQYAVPTPMYPVDYFGMQNASGGFGDVYANDYSPPHSGGAATGRLPLTNG